jgi:hypothetical protein
VFELYIVYNDGRVSLASNVASGADMGHPASRLHVITHPTAQRELFPGLYMYASYTYRIIGRSVLIPPALHGIGETG